LTGLRSGLFGHLAVVGRERFVLIGGILEGFYERLAVELIGRLVPDICGNAMEFRFFWFSVWGISWSPAVLASASFWFRLASVTT
jgi:hypothetical protein